MTRSRRRAGGTAVLCLTLVAAAGCSRQPPDGAVDRATAAGTVPGCWSLEVTAEGADRDSLRRWLPAGSLPTVLELDTVRVSEGPEGEPVYRARSYFDGRSEQGPFSAWRRIRGDSVLVERPGAMAGVCVGLAFAALYLVFYAVQPFPPGMVANWIMGAVAESVLAGALFGAIYKVRRF